MGSDQQNGSDSDTKLNESKDDKSNFLIRNYFPDKE